MVLTGGRVKKWLAVLTILGIIAILVSGCVARDAPVIKSLEAEQELVPPRYCCHIECNASDTEGGRLTYEWSVTGGTISGKGSSVTWNAPEVPDEYIISVNVTNEAGNWTTRSISIVVKENIPPEITELWASEKWVVPSGNCTIICEASDLDEDELSYEWSASGGNITGEGHTVTWLAPSDSDDYTIRVVVRDGMGGESSTSLSIKVATNHAPQIKSLVATYPRLKPGSSTEITCEASDPDGDELSYTWLADGGKISAKGHTATWVAPDCVNSYDITVVVKDGKGGEATETVQFQVRYG